MACSMVRARSGVSLWLHSSWVHSCWSSIKLNVRCSDSPDHPVVSGPCACLQVKESYMLDCYGLSHGLLNIQVTLSFWITLCMLSLILRMQAPFPSGDHELAANLGSGLAFEGVSLCSKYASGIGYPCSRWASARKFDDGSNAWNCWGRLVDVEEFLGRAFEWGWGLLWLGLLGHLQCGLEKQFLPGRKASAGNVQQSRCTMWVWSALTLKDRLRNLASMWVLNTF